MIILLYSFSVRRQNGWVGGGWWWWWGAFNYHGFTLFELLKLCSCQNDNGWLLMSRWKLFWSWQKIIIWSDLMASKSAISILVTICTHMYQQYVPIYISTYDMYPYLCTICTHIYIPYLAIFIIFIYNMYPHTYIYNMFLYLSIQLEICTTTSKFSY